MRIGLATDGEHPSLIDDDAPLRAALEARGAHVTAAIWDDADVAWDRFDAIVLRSTYDYIERVEDFLAWADRVAAVTRLHNPPAVVRWNAHKRYLDELEAIGVPTVPTELLAQGRAVDLAALLRRRSWGQAVVKPAVSAGARDTFRTSPAQGGQHQGELDRLLAAGDVLVQPFVESVATDGERSLVFFAGRYSHAVRKVAVGGDFRVQPQFGGDISADQPPQRIKDLARSILDAAEVDPLYARVDLVRIGQRWKLIELELIEPLLFLATAPGAADRFAAAILAAT